MLKTLRHQYKNIIKRLAAQAKAAWKTVNHASLKDKLYYGAMLLLLGSFVFQAILFALLVRQGVTPDENYHLSLIFLYHHQSGFLLHNSAATLFLGNVERIPFLYHLVMGKMLWLNMFPISDHVFLKAISILMSFGTIVFSWLAFRVATMNRAVHILGIGVLTHLLGYTFLASAIHPMVMLQFVTAVQIYCLFRLVKKRTPTALAWFLICFVLTPLISVAAFAINTACFFIIWFAWGRDIKKILRQIKLKSTSFFIAILICVGFGANGVFYGSNLMEFGRAVPTCHQLLTFEQCLDGKFAFRNEVEQMASKARTPFTLPISFYLNNWGEMMLRRVTGVAAQQKFCYERGPQDSCNLYRGKFFWHETTLFADYRIESAILLFLVIAAAMFCATILKTIINFNGKQTSDENRFLWYAILLSGFFVVSIIALNYGMYQGSGHLEFGVYGYNIFVVLPLLCFVFAAFLLRFFPKKIQIPVVGVVVLVFVWSSFPSFLQHAKTGEIIASTPNIVPLIRCDESRGYCQAITYPDRWSFCMPEKDWQCLEDEIGADMVF